MTDKVVSKILNIFYTKNLDKKIEFHFIFYNLYLAIPFFEVQIKSKKFVFII